MTLEARSDMMSDMKTFTVRDLDRQPGLILDACDTDGLVRIRRRDGRTYRLQPEHQKKTMATLPDFAERRKRLFPKALTQKQATTFDKLLAGD